MASILQLRRRIKAAQNVSKTTKAMQMIAASKLKKAQDATLSLRPYVEKLMTLTTQIADKVENKEVYPYLMNESTSKKSLIIFVSPDKGLSGSLITNLVREFFLFTQDKIDHEYLIIGKKAEGYITRLDRNVIASFLFGNNLPTYDMVYPIVNVIDEHYLKGNVSSVSIISTKFESFFTQKPHVTKLLPITFEKTEETTPYTTASDTLFEPDSAEILPGLLKHYLEMSVYQLLLENFLSQNAAQMIAMQNATNNANDIIDALKLEYNKTRQTKITSELLDLTGGRMVQN